jgi:hypothetical protein
VTGYALNRSGIQSASSCYDGKESVREHDWNNSGEAITNESHDQIIKTIRGSDITRKQSERVCDIY